MDLATIASLMSLSGGTMALGVPLGVPIIILIVIILIIVGIVVWWKWFK